MIPTRLESCFLSESWIQTIHAGELHMSMNKHQEGKVEKVTGKVKEVAGKVTGNKSLENRGKMQQIAGKTKEVVAGAAGKVAGKAQELAGKLQQGVGDAVDSEAMEKSGRTNEAKDKTRQDAND